MPAQVRIFGGKVQNQLNILGNEKTLKLQTKAEGSQLDKIKPLNKDVQKSTLNLSLLVDMKGESLHSSAAKQNRKFTVL